MNTTPRLLVIAAASLVSLAAVAQEKKIERSQLPPAVEKTVKAQSPGATIRGVWHALAGEFPALADYERSISTALNADYARMDAEVHDGDEIGFLPPVSGG